MTKFLGTTLIALFAVLSIYLVSVSAEEKICTKAKDCSFIDECCVKREEELEINSSLEELKGTCKPLSKKGETCYTQAATTSTSFPQVCPCQFPHLCTESLDKGVPKIFGKCA